MDNIVLYDILVGSASKAIKKAKSTGKLEMYELHLLSLFGKLLNDFDTTLTLAQKNCLREAIRTLQNHNSYICNYKDQNGASVANAINTAPVITDVNKTIASPNLTTYFTFTDFTSTFTDADGDSASKIRIKTLPTEGTLSYLGDNVSVNDEFTSTTITNLLYTWTDYTDQNDTFTFQVSDNNTNNPLFSNMGTFTINIATTVNQPPSQVGAITIGIANKAAHTFTSANFTTETTPAYLDPEGDAAETLRITTLPALGTLSLDGVAITQINQNVLFTDIAASKLVYTADQSDLTSHSANFNFSIADAGSSSFTSGGSATINIAAYVNQPPTTTDNTINDDEGDVYTFAMSDFPSSDPEMDAIVAVRFPTLPGAGNIKLNGVNVTINQEISSTDVDNNLLTYTQASNAGGTQVAFTFQVKDANGNWSS